jgi:hypothetical protein
MSKGIRKILRKSVTKGKSQVAIEFLMTYGWAMLVVAVIIGAIYTFGWFNPGDILPQRCDFYGQVGCRDYYLDESNFNLSLTNNFGSNLYIGKMVLIMDSDRSLKCNVTYENGNAVYWPRNKYNSTSINFVSANCPAFKAQINKGSRVALIANVSFYSYENCNACKDLSLNDALCIPCLHNSVGRINLKVS